MLKFLIIFFLVSYIIYKVGGYLLRSFFLSAGQQHQTRAHQQKKSRKVPDSDLNIDYVPNQKKSKKTFEGGEYVDYEDIK